MYIPTSVIKYSAIGATAVSALFSGLHYGSHGFIRLEQYAFKSYEKFAYRLMERVGLTFTDNIKDSQDLTLNDLITHAATKHEIKPELIHSLIAVESASRTDAIRFEPKLLKGSTEQDRMKASSHGLMQILGSWAGKAPCQNIDSWAKLYSPKDNIECGTAILSHELKRTGSVYQALIAYNGGASCNKNPSCLAQAKLHAEKVLLVLAESMGK